MNYSELLNECIQKNMFEKLDSTLSKNIFNFLKEKLDNVIIDVDLIFEPSIKMVISFVEQVDYRVNVRMFEINFNITEIIIKEMDLC